MSSYLKSKNSNIKIIAIYYVVIMLLTIFAVYKNGIILYQKNLISFIEIFKPLLIVLMSIIISYVTNYLIIKVIKKDNYIIKEDYDSIFMTLIILSFPLNINIIYYFLLLILFSVIKAFYNYNKINYYVVIKLLIILLLYILGKYSYLTIYDLSVETNLTTLDMFLGRSYGGLATSNILLIIICYFILFLNPSYKKEIPLISLLTYFVLTIICAILFKSSIITGIKNLICSEFIYGVVFIATISFYSPLIYKDRIIYAILIGVLSFIFNNIINIFDGVFVAIFITNIIMIIYQKVGVKLNEHKRI